MEGSLNFFLSISFSECGISVQLAIIEVLLSIDLKPFQINGGIVTVK